MTKHPAPPPRSPGPFAIGVIVLAVLGLRLLWIGFYGTSAPAGSSSAPRTLAPGEGAQFTGKLIKEDPLMAAMALSDKGDHGGGVRALTKVLEKGPSAAALNGRGVAWFRLGKKDQALADFDKAVALDSRLADAWMNRATLREAIGDAAGALSDLTKVVELAPKPAEMYCLALLNRARLLAGKGRPKEAAADLERAVMAAPAGWRDRAAAESLLDEVRRKQAS